MGRDDILVSRCMKAALLAPILSSVFGVLGALLLAMPLPAWGFGAFLISNVA